MDEQHTHIQQMQAITVSRQYGSGGGEIAARLAQRLNWQLLDHEAVIHVAQQLDISHAEAEAQDEHVDSLGERILYSLRAIQSTMPATLPAPIGPDIRAYHQALCRVIEAALAEGQVVIVGRGAQMLLEGRRDILHVRVVAALEGRVTYVMSREGLTREQALARIQYKDQGRIRYLQEHFRQHPDNPRFYDLVVNTSVITLDRAVDMICLALESKAERLSVPQEELGPGVAMPRYPTQPADFSPPPDATKPVAE